MSPDTFSPQGFNIPQDTLSFLPDPDDDTPDYDMVSDDGREEDGENYYISESNNTTDTESIDEIRPKQPYSIPKPILPETNFPDELSPETDFVDE